MVREIPRLSTYLRTHGNVCHPDDKFLDCDENNDIIEKKREAEIVKRRLLAKRKAEEEGKNVEKSQKSLFGSNIPFNFEFITPRLSEEELKKFTRPNPAEKFHLKNEINFDFQEKEQVSRYVDIHSDKISIRIHSYFLNVGEKSVSIYKHVQ